MKKIMMMGLLVLSFSMVSCAKSTELDAPCKDYGKRCSQVPINGWDYQ